jgi:hypothetical protein
MFNEMLHVHENHKCYEKHTNPAIPALYESQSPNESSYFNADMMHSPIWLLLQKRFNRTVLSKWVEQLGGYGKSRFRH